MVRAVRLIGLLLVLLTTMAIGGPQDDGAPTGKQVFPLAKEGGLWWAGVGDLCDIVGARFDGDFGARMYNERGERIRVEAFIRVGGSGPFKIAVGEDTYEFTLDKLPITRNGEEFGDFVMAPKRIEGVICAPLEDLERILGFELGEEAEGQPTIHHGGKQYRLVKGERGTPTLTPGDIIVEAPDGQRRQLEQVPFVWRGWPGATAPQPEGGLYTEHNGMTYRRGTWGVQVGPYAPPQTAGAETLFGPVVPNRYHAEGQAADLMFLSIVRRQVLKVGVARTGPMGPRRDLPEDDRDP
ncbi:MAG: hypothetical protein FJX74_07625 [Armatimonadetes bacterium]|nr:hypothetical protein [Armatimonadota bacterium]